MNIVLLSKEGDKFTVESDVAKLSKLIETTMDDENDTCSANPIEIPLPNVNSMVLKKVIEYCEHYKKDVMTPIQTPLKSSVISELVQQWYADYINVDQNLLFDLVTAANFMDIKPLLDLTCLAVAVMIKGKSAEDIRKIFNISNDFTPEEEIQVEMERKWCAEQEQQQSETNATKNEELCSSPSEQIDSLAKGNEK